MLRAKNASQAARRGLHGAVAGLVVALLAAPPALAAPVGPQVVRGKARIHKRGRNTRIVVKNGTVIDWQSFDVAAGERVRFVQRGARSRVLNRVLRGSASQIDGLIQARGQVYIVNPAGVFFGGRALVDVGRLVAVAGSMSNRDFAAGDDRLTGLHGDVVNRGRLQGDSVVLVGRRVANHGEILTESGDILMLAGDVVWLGRHGSHVLVQIQGPDAAQADRSTADRFAVENSGRLDAGRGRARLAAGDSMAFAIRQHGEIRAREIALQGGQGGLVDVSGRLDASAESGGRIDVRGDWVALRSADIDASGDAGGGQIRIGGAAPTEADAAPGGRGVYVSRDSQIRADARVDGDGGDIIVFASGGTRVFGRLSARGGERGGDGGFVETSGLEGFQVGRAADVSAPRGRGGSWLIDPLNIEVVASGGALDTAAGATPLNPGDPAIFQSDEADSSVGADVIVAALSGGTSVIITTDRFLGEGDSEGDIRVNAPIVVSQSSFDTDASLSLRAANDIIVNQPIQNNAATLQLDVELIANNNALMPLLTTISQDELGESAGPDSENDAFERGDVQIANGIDIVTGGGSLAIQGVNVDIGGDLTTDGGSLLVFGLNPRIGGEPLLADAGSVTSRGTISTAASDAGADGGVRLTAGGLLRVEAPIQSGAAGVLLDATDIVIAADINAGSVQLGRAETELGSTVLPQTESAAIQGSITSVQADAVFQARTLQIDAPVVSGGGNISASGENISIGAALDASDGTVQITGQLDVDLAAGVSVDASEIDLRAGLDLADSGQSGTLSVAGADLRADRITLIAGDGFIDDTATQTSGTIVAAGARFAGTGGIGAPQALNLTQDADLDDASIPALSRFGNGSLADLGGMQYTLASADGDVTLATASKVAGANLVLSGRNPADVQVPILPESVALRAASGIVVTPTLADRLRPTRALELHAGSDGVGNLDFDPGVTLRANEIALRSGDGTSETNTAARIDAVSNAPGFRSGAGTAPLAFALRQDAGLTDADVPSTTQFGGSVAGLAYGLRSDDGSVALDDPAKFQGSDLAVVARSGISLAQDLSLRSADFGGVDSFTVTEDLLDRIALDPTGPQRLVLRAAAGGAGSLDFAPASSGDGLIVRAREIRLVASDGQTGTGDGNVDANPALSPPRFVSATDDNLPPEAFAIQQDRAVVGDALPTVDQFGDGTALPLRYGVRSDEGSVSFSNLDRVPTTANGRLVVAGDLVTISSTLAADIEFGAPGGTLEIRAKTVLLQVTDPNATATAPEDRAVVDASAGLELGNFDAESPDFDLDAGAIGSPDSFSIRQEGDLVASQLPAADAFGAGTADVAYALTSIRGSIAIDDPAPVAQADLNLTVEPLDPDEDPILGRSVGFGTGHSFDLASLRVSTPEGFALGAGTQINASDTLQIFAGVAGEGGDLGFAAGTKLEARSIALRAGNGPLPATDEAVVASRVDARTNAPQFSLVSADPAASTSLAIEQDGDIVGATLPLASQISTAGAPLDAYAIQSDEGSVEIDGLANLPARDVQVLSAFSSSGNSPRITLRASSGDLDFGDPSLPIESLRLFAPRIELLADAPSGRVFASSAALRLFGDSGTGSLPAAFAIRQGAALTSASGLPDLSQFARQPDLVGYSLESTAGDVLFDDAVAARTGGTRLELIASGDVRLTPSAVALQSLSVEAGGQIFLGDAARAASISIDTPEGQRYAADVTLLEDALLLGRGVVFEGRVDGARDLRVVTSGPARFGSDVGATAPLLRLEVEFDTSDGAFPQLEFGSAGSNAPLSVEVQGDILFNPSGRGDPPPTASVFKSQGDLLFHTTDGDFRMGRGEKLSVNGMLQIRLDAAGGTATVGDLVARDRIAVDATTLQILRRPAGFVFRPDGSRVPDPGVHVVSNQIDFGVADLQILGSGPAPVFGVPDPQVDPDFFASLLGGRRLPLAAVHSDLSPLVNADFDFEAIGIDVVPRGPSRADVSRSFAETGRPPQRPAPGDRLAAELGTLHEVGISVRPPSAQEHLARLSGAGIFDDRAGDFVVDRRLHPQQAEQAVALFRRLFGPDNRNAAEIRTVLQAALTQYRETTLARRVVGFEFRRFVKNRPASLFGAYQALEDLDALFRAHRNAGLTPAAYRRIQHDWLTEIVPEGISVDELSEAIHPSRYVRGSDVLDIFGD